MDRKTILSECRQYRYCLWRQWDLTDPSYAVFVGLNPSTADESTDDPTLRRCMDYAKSWGYGAVCIVNLFAFRATNPREMKVHPEPVGKHNDQWIVDVAKPAAVVVAAWGAAGTHGKRDRAVMRLLEGRLSCLARTKGGHPSHPLYLKKSLEPQPFP